MRIERLEPAAKPRGCFLLTTEDGDTLLVTDRELVSFSIVPAGTLDDEQWEALCFSAGRSLALQRAAAMLGRRALSRRELTDRLLEKGVLPEHAHAAADRMAELGILDDAAYAATLARHYAARLWGPHRVEHELFHRGVDRALWPDALDAVDDWNDVAVEFLRSRRYDPCDTREKRKLTETLVRRGFDWDAARSALRTLEQENAV